MRRLVAGLALLLAAGTTASAHDTFINNGEHCSSNNFRWNGRQAVVEQQTIDAGHLRSLKASVTHAPIAVIGGSSEYRIEVCKAAARQEDLAQIRVSLDGSELRATGPDDSRWHVSYRVYVPAGADVDVSAENGPVSIRDVDGKVVARAANGPLALHNVTGNVDATTTNGPISVRGGSGNMKVRASNGPLSVQLDGNAWIGDLDAATKNGPLTVKIPRGYNSGVKIESNGGGPLSCRAEGCERFRAASWEDRWGGESPRVIELGRGPANVRLSTVNGPITIKDE